METAVAVSWAPAEGVETAGGPQRWESCCRHSVRPPMQRSAALECDDRREWKNGYFPEPQLPSLQSGIMLRRVC